ncbi:hypothetical protein [Xanthomonas arboricola]|nr:hypothetical protein [Xanthomonas arboricola]
MDSITDSSRRRPEHRQAFVLSHSRARQDQDGSVASEDLNALCNEARGFAEYMLMAHGEFIPFGVLMRPDGTIAQVAGDLGVERSISAEMVKLLQASFSQSARIGAIRAACICMEMSVMPPGQEDMTDAICTRLAHVSGETVEVFVPHSRDARGALQLGQPFATVGDEFTLVER